MKDFFVSYNETDRHWAEWIAWQLEAEGSTTILQAWDFRPGGNFVLEMNRAVQEAERVLVVLSPAFLAASFTAPEWAAFFAQDPKSAGRRVLPVRVLECEIQGILASIVYVDLVGRDEEEARAALLSGIRDGRAKPAVAPLFPGARSGVAPKFPGAAPAATVSSAHRLWIWGSLGLVAAVIGIVFLPWRNGGPNFRKQEQAENDIIYVHIDGGSFSMGSIESDRQAAGDEQPQHTVTLSEFWIGKTEITNAQYRRFDHDHPGEADLPATKVNWYQAKAACEYFGGRLPTEAEWEYAARAGTQTPWSYGDDEKKLEEFAWYGKNSKKKGQLTVQPVRGKSPNPWGLFDMHGNVWEWVNDWYDGYDSAPRTNPHGPPTGEYRVQRSGAFDTKAQLLRSAHRGRSLPEMQDGSVGFRCVRDTMPKPKREALS